MRGFRSVVIFSSVLAGWFYGARQAGASVVLVTDQSTYNQDTSGLTTIDFNSFVPSGQTSAAYNTSAGLVSGPVDFVGQVTSGTWQGGTNFLYAITPAYYPSYDAYPNSPTVLSGPPGAGSNYSGIAGSLNVTLGGNYSAVGSGLYVVTDGVSGTSSGAVEIAVTDLSGTYDFTITTSGQYINFAGFLSDSRITSIQYITQDVDQYPELSNFSYGVNASAVPEPSSLVLLGAGGAAALGFLLLRKKRGL